MNSTRLYTALLVLAVVVPLLFFAPQAVVIPVGALALVLFAAIWLSSKRANREGET